MKQKIYKYLPAAISVVFGLAVWYFWTKPYLSALSFQEQYQLFLSTGDYFVERICVPGGLADYLAEWLTQWYRYTAVGGLIIAIMMVTLQLLTWQVGKNLGAKPAYYPLSFLPAMFLWGYMGDINVMLSFILSLVGAIALVLAYRQLSARWIQSVFVAVAMPIGYWLLGPGIFVTALLILGCELIHKPSFGSLFIGAGALAYLCVIAITVSYFVAYPIERFFVGINYYRYPVYNPMLQIVAMALLVVVPLLIAKLPAVRFVAPITTVAIAVACGFWVRSNFNEKEYELLDYDYLLRTEQWSKVIAKAEKKQASQPMSVCVVNLALSETRQLADRLFEFYQNGGGGLIPEFESNMLMPIAPAEVYYRLGMVNECERYMFEAQEAIPNHRKSGRLTQRIIDCQIVNGHYAVARKQLHLLAKSPTYRRWAENRLAILGNEKAINEDAVYGRLRQVRQQTADFLYDGRDVCTMLGLLLKQNAKNKMAYEYLISYALLEGDLDHFMQYYALGSNFTYTHIPRPVQEVLIGSWIQQHGSPEGIPYSVDQYTVRNVMDFIRTFSTNSEDPRLNAYPLAANAWNYLLHGQKKSERKETTKPIY